jgi:DNA-binding NarL/FixJ family response regulator
MAQSGESCLPIRILIVDDCERWRDYLRSRLCTGLEFQVIGESWNGLQAVQQCAALQPDLVLLDINIPGINGIKAATRIFEVAPQAKVLFLSADSDPATVRASLDVGAHGYIPKAKAGTELVPAIKAARREIAS